MKRLEKTYNVSIITVITCIWMFVFCGSAQALESGSYRLLSVSVTEKLVLVSRVPDQKKFLLDAADVKVNINDEPAEFSDLILFTVVQVQMEQGKRKKKNVNLDGRAIEITISDPAGNKSKEE